MPFRFSKSERPKGLRPNFCLNFVDNNNNNNNNKKSTKSMEDEAGDDLFWQLAVVAHQQNIMMAMEVATETEERVDHRTLPRGGRRQFCHAEAAGCLMRDYLGDNPLLGKEFPLMFRISRNRFQCIMEDVMKAEISFYKRHPRAATMDATLPLSKQHSCFEARLLLPLKCLSYGVPSHTFSDYFQMSQTFARQCCEQFDAAIIKVYKTEYLRLPTAEDLKAIIKLHKAVHQAKGLFGSLDCTHTYWKNCPKAWQGSYKGKEKQCSIVLEAISDYHMWFWHCSYGFAGTLNDKNILNLSPFLERLLDGSFASLEKEAGVVPFYLDETDPFHLLFILVDGIYPRYSRFVRGIKAPITSQQQKFTAWQEAARKDIERAFGVLKERWQFLQRPIHLHSLEDIGKRVTCCLILHNICISDRIMQDCKAKYNPAFSIVEENEEVEVEQPTDLLDVQHIDMGGVEHTAVEHADIGIANAPAAVVQLVTRKDRFQQLENNEEHLRLHAVLMQKCVDNWN